MVQNLNSVNNDIVTSSHSNQLGHEIVYIEGRDNIRGGSGSISLDGGVGLRNFTVALKSGVGEDLYYSMYFYGFR